MDNIKVTILEDTSPLNPAEFAEYLFFLRAALFALKEIVPVDRLQPGIQPTQEEIERYSSQLNAFSPNTINSFFSSHRDPEVIEITRIKRNSPLEMTVVVCGFLMTLAVILSGGRISVRMTGISAELPAFGKGLKSLKEALGLGSSVKAEFGIKPVVIKLNKKEFDELFVQSPETKGGGGFQHFLVGLQHRINKTTKQLELSESDLERIFR